MNEILTLVTFLALLFYTGIEMKFQLQMLQQNSYRNDRYNRWLKGESFATISRLTDLFLLLLLSTNFLPSRVSWQRQERNVTNIVSTNRHDYSGLGKKRKRVTNQI